MANDDTIETIIRGMYAVPERAVVVLHLETHAELVAATPVDTGFAVSQWVPAVGQPFGGVAGSPDAVSRSEQDQGTVHVLGYKLTDGQVWDTNNADYIEALDGGSSDQAPTGFVQIAVNKGVAQATEKLDREIK